jgi:hypothetical protein
MTTVKEAPMQLTTRLKVVQWPENNTRGLAHHRNLFSSTLRKNPLV